VTNRSGAVRAGEAGDRLGEGADGAGDEAVASPGGDVRPVAAGATVLLSDVWMPTEEAGEGAAAGLAGLALHALNGSSTTMAAPITPGPHLLRKVINPIPVTLSDAMEARPRPQ
jgi:hypothetical protein